LSEPTKGSGGAYLKYSGLAFQMFAILLLGWWFGSLADSHFGFEKPYLGISLCFLFLIGFLFKLYVDVTKGVVSGSFIIKLVIAIGFLATYRELAQPTNGRFALHFIIVYIIYTVYEVYFLTKLAKTTEA